jgi:hypothetical protein
MTWAVAGAGAAWRAATRLLSPVAGSAVRWPVTVVAGGPAAYAFVAAGRALFTLGPGNQPAGAWVAILGGRPGGRRHRGCP